MVLSAHALTPPPDLATVVALAREGLTLQAIGARVGRSRGRVHQILRDHGYSIRVLRDIRCAACGARLEKAELTTRSGRHYCSDAACNPAYEREQREVERRELEHLRAIASAARAVAAADTALGVQSRSGYGPAGSVAWHAEHRGRVLDFYGALDALRAALDRETRG